MALKLAANLNFLFTEDLPSLSVQIKRAKLSGFNAVEIPFPQYNSDDVINMKNDTNIDIALVNIALGSDDLKFGSASIPGKEEIFKQQLTETINFAKKIKCDKIHIMAGVMKSGSYENHLRTYKNNLTYAKGILEQQGLVGVIEPINKYSIPSYFLSSFDLASTLLRELNSENLKLMVDIFHLQNIKGNITNTFVELKDLIGHIQIAQVPHRNEPDTPGELNFSYIFQLIKESGYKSWIGCEYKPKSNTIEGLKWISNCGL